MNAESTESTRSVRQRLERNEQIIHAVDDNQPLKVVDLRNAEDGHRDCIWLDLEGMPHYKTVAELYEDEVQIVWTLDEAQRLAHSWNELPELNGAIKAILAACARLEHYETQDTGQHSYEFGLGEAARQIREILQIELSAGSPEKIQDTESTEEESDDTQKRVSDIGRHFHENSAIAVDDQPRVMAALESMQELAHPDFSLSVPSHVKTEIRKRLDKHLGRSNDEL